MDKENKENHDNVDAKIAKALKDAAPASHRGRGPSHRSGITTPICALQTAFTARQPYRSKTNG